jgi:hypothetical protein
MSVIPKYASGTFLIYYCDDYKGHLVDYYKNKSFPLNGWLKFCIMCRCVTSKFEKYKIKHTKEVIIVNICPRCQKMEKEDKNKYISIFIDKIINYNYLEDIYTNNYKFEKINDTKKTSHKKSKNKKRSMISSYEKVGSIGELKKKKLIPLSVEMKKEEKLVDDILDKKNCGCIIS